MGQKSLQVDVCEMDTHSAIDVVTYRLGHHQTARGHHRADGNASPLMKIRCDGHPLETRGLAAKKIGGAALQSL